MVFIPRTYVRAAGIQSEIGKMAVNKVACLENEYRRMVYMAKMDMKKTLREMKHNREMISRSMGHYRKKLREYHIVKKKKYLTSLDECPAKPAPLEKERAKEASASTVTTLALPEIYPSRNTISSQKSVAAKPVKSKRTDVVPAKRVSTPNEPPCKEVCLSEGQVLLDDEIHLPPIHTEKHHSQIKEGDRGVTTLLDVKNEVNQAKCINNSSSDTSDHKEPQRPKHSIGSLAVQTAKSALQKASKTTSSDEENSREATINSISQQNPKAPKKRRTGAVNLANIMRLQYSTNLTALFKTVDVLARVHGINVPAPESYISGPRRISKLPQPRRESRTAQLQTVSRTSEHRRISRKSVPGNFSGDSDTRRFSQISGPSQTSEISGSRKISQFSQERRLSRASDEHPKHILPSDYLYNMKHGYLHTEEPVEEVSNTGGVSLKNNSPLSGGAAPSPKSTEVYNDLTEKGSRKVSQLSARSSLYSSRRVSTVYNPISSSQSTEFAESRSGGPALRGDRTLAKVSKSSLPQPYSDDYFERTQLEPDKDVAWRTAFRMLKHVHFIDSFIN